MIERKHTKLKEVSAMNTLKVDYRSNVGRFVLVMLPDVTGRDTPLEPVVERTKALAKKLEGMLGGARVGYMAGPVSFLEFFWADKLELDTEKVNQALNQLVEDNPDLTINFQNQSGFPPMGL